MGKRVAGTCFIKVDGDQLEVSGAVECPLMPVTREAVAGLNSAGYYSEKVLTPYVKLTAIFVDEFPVATLQENTDMTITAELANGKVYTLAGAFLVGEPSAKGDDGTIELEFNGREGRWQ